MRHATALFFIAALLLDAVPGSAQFAGAANGIGTAGSFGITGGTSGAIGGGTMGPNAGFLYGGASGAIGGGTMGPSVGVGTPSFTPPFVFGLQIPGFNPPSVQGILPFIPPTGVPAVNPGFYGLPTAAGQAVFGGTTPPPNVTPQSNTTTANTAANTANTATRASPAGGVARSVQSGTSVTGGTPATVTVPFFEPPTAPGTSGLFQMVPGSPTVLTPTGSNGTFTISPYAVNPMGTMANPGAG